MTKLLFITKPTFMEPLGLMYLSAAAKKAGHNVTVATTEEDLEQKIQTCGPDVIGYSVITGDQGFYTKLNNRLKQNSAFISIFGGPHPTFFPEMIQEEGVDVICRGEGEGGLVDLLDAVKDTSDIKDITAIPNLYVKQKGTIYRNEVRPLADIDSLAFPDRELFKDHDMIQNNPIKHIMASRGCFFSCTYCFNSNYAALYKGKGQRVRQRDIGSLMKEIKEATAISPTKTVYFQDDTFTFNRDWLEQFSKAYATEIGLPFHCHARPNTVDQEKISFLKAAGCTGCHMAVETADDYLRNTLLKRNMSREQIIKASRLLRENNIPFMLQNIIGLPEGNLEKDLETLELNAQCQPSYAWVSIFQPYPGTVLGEYCKKKGYYTGDFNDIDSSFFDSSKLNFSDEYKNQLSNLQKLFALFTARPKSERQTRLRRMIDIQATPEIRDRYKKAYLDFRNKADKELYGFELKR